MNVSVNMTPRRRNPNDANMKPKHNKRNITNEQTKEQTKEVRETRETDTYENHRGSLSISRNLMDLSLPRGFVKMSTGLSTPGTCATWKLLCSTWSRIQWYARDGGVFGLGARQGHVWVQPASPLNGPPTYADGKSAGGSTVVRVATEVSIRVRVNQVRRRVV